jgi:hypothetical protein
VPTDDDNIDKTTTRPVDASTSIDWNASTLTFSMLTSFLSSASVSGTKDDFEFGYVCFVLGAVCASTLSLFVLVAVCASALPLFLARSFVARCVRQILLSLGAVGDMSFRVNASTDNYTADEGGALTEKLGTLNGNGRGHNFRIDGLLWKEMNRQDTIAQGRRKKKRKWMHCCHISMGMDTQKMDENRFNHFITSLNILIDKENIHINNFFEV